MKGLSLLQVEQLKQIGDYLLQVRENQGISLEKIAKDTFIPLRLLKALEVGDVDRLPEPVYVKGFIRRYGDALGLDGAEIADAFDADVAPVPQVAVAPGGEPVHQESVSVASAPVEPRTPELSRFDSPGRSRFPIWIYVLSGVAALGALAAVAYGLSRPAQQYSQSSSESSTATKSSRTSPTTSGVAPTVAPTSASRPTASSSPNSLSAAPSPGTDSNALVKVDISLTDRSWMEVVADGKVEFEGILAKGEQRTWTAQNNLEIRAGNAGAVVASHNQGQAKPLGRLGDVVDASFSRDGETLRSAGSP